MAKTREDVVAAYRGLKEKGLDPIKDSDNEEVKHAEDLYGQYANSQSADDLSDKEALELNQKISYDLILIDAGLGDADSYDAALDFLEQDLEQAREMADNDLVKQIEAKIAQVKSEAGV